MAVLLGRSEPLLDAVNPLFLHQFGQIETTRTLTILNQCNSDATNVFAASNGIPTVWSSERHRSASWQVP